jgi:Mn-containing catalase
MTNNSPNIAERLDRIEALLADTADVTLSHGEILANLVTTVSNHDSALSRIENALNQLTTQTEQLTA